MRNPFIALLWKEWRQGRAVMLLLWALAIPVGHLVGGRVQPQDHPAKWVLPGVAFLCLCGAMVGARLFASEGEEGTIRFLARQPVEPGMVWSTKLLVGVVFLCVLYALWWWTGPRLSVPVARHEYYVSGAPGEQRLISVYFDPQVAWWPLVALAASLCLSAVLDNTILALVGGAVGVVALAIAQEAVARFVVWRLYSPLGEPVHAVVPTLVVLLGVVVVLLVVSRVVFGVRVRR